jgi:hypothetical protein
MRSESAHVKLGSRIVRCEPLPHSAIVATDQDSAPRAGAMRTESRDVSAATTSPSAFDLAPERRGGLEKECSMRTPVVASIVSRLLGPARIEPERTVRIGPDIWNILEDAFGLSPDAVPRVLGAADVAGVVARWRADGLGVDDARRIAQELREVAFNARHLGAVAVRLVPPTNHESEADPPGVLVTLAAVLDFLAGVAGGGGAIRFVEEREVGPDAA